MNHSPSATRRLVPVGLAAVTLLLAACGGGGGAEPASPPPPAAAPAGVDAATRAAVLAAGPALEAAPPTLSGNVTCANLAIGAIALDTVTVPRDSACRLEGTALIGSIRVAPGATLEASGVRINGSLQAEGAAHVALVGGATVGGSVQVRQGGSALIDGARITGDLQIDAQRAAVVARANQVGGSLQAVGNLGGLLIEDNTMDGNLQCKENLPAPRVSGNVAASIEDQCVPAAGGGGSGGGSSGGGGTVAAGPVSGNVRCDGLRIGAVTVDTVTVPDNAVCVLEGTRLTGSILVGRNASLSASDLRVDGNLQADGAAQTALGGVSTIGGSVQIGQGGSASVTGAAITGDLQFDGMAGPVLASGNAVGGNLQAVGNAGGVALTANRMGGNLQCKENQPEPTGGGNVAASKEDQCRSL